MDENQFEILTEKLRQHLDSSEQNWLFGAGISYISKIPLMYPLTERVEELVNANEGDVVSQAIYNAIKEELLPNSHIEHFLSHLGDLIALCKRNRSNSANIGTDTNYTEEQFLKLYDVIIGAIGETIRYGYWKSGDDIEIGTSTNPIIEIGDHINFIKALYKNISNLTSRSRLTFFTTNYDTLLEDALGLQQIEVVDGFSGGGVGFWDPNSQFSNFRNKPNECLLYKLHGSIDWHKDEKYGLVRSRYGTKYLDNISDILIYPQATKYTETQKDPFSFLFSGFRDTLNSSNDNVLITCGYSFGDEHINAEIELAMQNRTNCTTLIAFVKEQTEEGIVINAVLDEWISKKPFGNRIYIAGEKGIYYNSLEPTQPTSGGNLSWWTFSGLTKYLETNDYE